MVYENSVCILHSALPAEYKKNGMSLFREIVTVCCGNSGNTLETLLWVMRCNVTVLGT